MVLTPSSSSSSCSSSFGSIDEDAAAVKASSASPAVKFLCSYGGRILPRYLEGKLRYVGGDTRVLSVDRSVSFPELQEKMREMCGWSGAVGVRCQLPTEDLDALVSVKSDEDLANVVAEYDLTGRHKVRVFLFPPAAKPTGKSSGGESPTRPTSAAERCLRQMCAPSRLAGRADKTVATAAWNLRHHGHRHHHLQGHAGATRPCNYMVHHGSYWQQ